MFCFSNRSSSEERIRGNPLRVLFGHLRGGHFFCAFRFASLVRQNQGVVCRLATLILVLRPLNAGAKRLDIFTVRGTRCVRCILGGGTLQRRGQPLLQG